MENLKLKITDTFDSSIKSAVDGALSTCQNKGF